MNTELTTSSAVAAAPTEPSTGAVYGLFLKMQDSDDTRRAYDQSIRAFGGFLFPEGFAGGDRVVAVLRSIDGQKVNLLATAYRARLLEQKLANNTVNGRLSNLRSLTQWMRQIGLINWELHVKNVRSTKYRDTRGPSRGGFDQILGVIAGDTVKARRDRAIVMLLYFMAMRRGKVAAIDVDDLDLSASIAFTRKKGGGEEKFRKTLPPEVCAALRGWIEVRPGVRESDGRQPLFVNLDRASRPGRLTGKSIWKLVMGYGRAVGIKAWPHGLRHAAITDALDRHNGDVRKVQKFSEHADLNTLIKYDDARRDFAGEVACSLASGAV